MTPNQIELARHALGFQRPQIKQSYRNSFVAGPGHDDHAAWIEMVSAGDATRIDGATIPFGGDDLFHLTKTGAQKALRRGERLSPEDFP